MPQMGAKCIKKDIEIYCKFNKSELSVLKIDIEIYSKWSDPNEFIQHTIILKKIEKTY